MNERDYTIDHGEEQLDPPPTDGESYDAAVEDYDSPSERDDVPWLPEPPRSYRAMRRVLDVIASLLLMALFAPFMVIIALAIRLTSRGPVLFTQTRLGYRGKPFALLRFRTMYRAYPGQQQMTFVQQLISGQYGPVGKLGVFKLTHDPRITPIGRFLRKTSLDELPQFWNVLKGDMSLVGPRPPMAYEWTVYSERHKQRLSGKPGITGLWQIYGTLTTSFDQMAELDIQYLKHPSILQDLKILLTTPLAVVRGDKAF